MSRKPASLLFRWRDAFCSSDGPPSTTRLVLWTVSKHMDSEGGGAWPAQGTIAAESGLQLSAVKMHLKLAEELGWLRRAPRRRGRQASYRYGTDYVASIPLSKEPIGSPDDPKLGHVVPLIGSRGGDLGRHVTTSPSGSTSRTASGTSTGTEAGKGQDAAPRLRDALPSIEPYTWQLGEAPAQQTAGGAAQFERADVEHSRTAPGTEAQMLLDRVRRRQEERVARFGPRQPRPQRKPHLLDPLWTQGLILLAEGTGFGPAHQNAFLGLKVKRFGWKPVSEALCECVAKGLTGRAAQEFVAERFR